MKVKLNVSFPLLTCCLLFAAITLLVSGCLSHSPVAPPQPSNAAIAVIDMDKAMQAHPKYQEGIDLQKQLNTLLASQQVLANQQPVATDAGTGSPDLATSDIAGQNMHDQQLYQEKMSAKQAQLKTDFDAKYTALRKQASDEYNAYSEQLDKEYQPTVFDIQLKLKTLQLTKEEGDALQAKLDKLNKEKSDKLAAKEKELTTALNGQLADEQRRSAAELDSYGQQTAAALRSADPPAANVAVPNQEQTAPQPPVSPDNQAAIDQLKAQMAALKALMIQDIENQCGKIAQDKGYEIVVTNVTANIHADDITADVIAQFKN